MADIHDYIAAAAETDEALRTVADLRGILARAPRDQRTEGGALALAILAATDALVWAIREASTRADYVAHDLRR